MSLLTPYTQPLTALQAAHLLRRTVFGASPNLIKQFTGLTPATAVQTLLAEPPTPEPPIDPTTNVTFVNVPFIKTMDSQHSYLKNWWLGLMIQADASIRESLVLFWQNHFVSTFSTVSDPRYMFRQNALIRSNAMGNFRQLVIAMTKDPAMLRYLNGDQNIAGTPNENYGRELQELFTIGRGNYTEDDVKAAARVLTGWADTGYRDTTQATVATVFRASHHDTTDKQFSASYQNTVIKGRSGATAGDAELADLIDMILRQPEVARFICRKLYRWFVAADLTPDLETNLIEPLAQVFRQASYDLAPVLTTLLTSQHFYDDTLRGSIIKSPMDLIVGSFRFFSISIPDQTQNPAAFQLITNVLNQRARDLQQDLLDQPTVFGWRPYYDTGFYEIWISANTLALRGAYTDTLLHGFKYNNVAFVPNSLALVQTLTKPEDPVSLMDELTNLVFAVPLTRAQKDFLIDQVLIVGLPRYEWTNEWLTYANDSKNTTKQLAVRKKLDALLAFMMRMAEYQTN